MIPMMIVSIEDDSDRSFVEALYIKYEKNLYLHAKKFLNNASYAEDCVHDAFKALIENLEKLRGQNELSVLKYLVICCRNSAIGNYNNKEKRLSLSRGSNRIEPNKELEIEDNSSDVGEIVINKEIKEILKKCIDALDPKYRDVMILKYEFFLKSKEIAKVLYISEELVRQRLMRARRILKASAGEELYGLFKG